MSRVSPRDVARSFHDAYERLAPEYGYVTRPETRAFDPDSPNGCLMTAVVEAVVWPLLRSLCEAQEYADRAARDRVLQSVTSTRKRGIYSLGLSGPFIAPATRHLAARGMLKYLPGGKIQLFDEPQEALAVQPHQQGDSE